MTRPRFLDAGECALAVEFGNAIEAAINARVMALDAALGAAPIAGVRETVPTYRSLLIHFDPVVVRREALKRAVAGRLAATAIEAASPGRRWRVPVLYDGEDLDAVASLHGMSRQDVVSLHSGADYRVYMIGFAPGFSYLGGLPEAIHTSRRTTPRMKTPPCSISIGGRQAAVAPPLELPSGWHLLGRTAVRSYDPGRNGMPFLFRPGDRIRFQPVDRARYEHLRRAAEAGERVAELCEEAGDGETEGPQSWR